MTAKTALPPVAELAAMVRASTAIAVAAELGCNPATVRRALKWSGYNGRGRPDSSPNGDGPGASITLPDATDLAAMVRRSSPEQVAADFGCSVRTIRSRLDAAGYTPGGTDRSEDDPIRFPPFDPKPWEVDAVCASTDPEAYFPEKGSTNRPAKTVCSLCPVREECLDYALRHGIEFGVWGGLSEQERRELDRQREVAA